MRMILLGAGGSGKGTQAIRIRKTYGLPYIATGDIFRDHIGRGTEVGLEAKEYISKGLLVPDEVTIRLIRTRFMEPDCANGFLLDGFPRNQKQAAALKAELDAHGVKIDAVLNLKVSEETIIQRTVGRRLCTSCGEIYNVFFNKPKVEETCDCCGSALFRRSDDTLEAVQTRLKIYGEETAPLIEYYTQQGCLYALNGEVSTEEIFAEIQGVVENLQKNEVSYSA